MAATSNIMQVLLQYVVDPNSAKTAQGQIQQFANRLMQGQVGDSSAYGQTPQEEAAMVANLRERTKLQLEVLELERRYGVSVAVNLEAETKDLALQRQKVALLRDQHQLATRQTQSDIVNRPPTFIQFSVFPVAQLFRSLGLNDISNRMMDAGAVLGLVDSFAILDQQLARLAANIRDSTGFLGSLARMVQAIVPGVGSLSAALIGLGAVAIPVVGAFLAISAVLSEMQRQAEESKKRVEEFASTLAELADKFVSGSTSSDLRDLARQEELRALALQSTADSLRRNLEYLDSIGKTIDVPTDVTNLDTWLAEFFEVLSRDFGATITSVDELQAVIADLDVKTQEATTSADAYTAASNSALAITNDFTKFLKSDVPEALGSGVDAMIEEFNRLQEEAIKVAQQNKGKEAGIAAQAEQLRIAEKLREVGAAAQAEQLRITTELENKTKQVGAASQLYSQALDLERSNKEKLALIALAEAQAAFDRKAKEVGAAAQAEQLRQAIELENKTKQAGLASQQYNAQLELERQNKEKLLAIAQAQARLELDTKVKEVGAAAQAEQIRLAQETANKIKEAGYAQEQYNAQLERERQNKEKMGARAMAFQEAMDAIALYQEQITELTDEFQRQARLLAEERAISARREAEDFGRSRERTLEAEARAMAREDRDRARRQEREQKEAARRFEDFLKRIRQIIEDFALRMSEAVAERDALAFVRAKRERDKRLKEEDENYKEAEKRREEDLKDEQDYFEESRRERIEDFQRRLREEDDDRALRLRRQVEDYQRRDLIEQDNFNRRRQQLLDQLFTENAILQATANQATFYINYITSSFISGLQAMAQYTATAFTGGGTTTPDHGSPWAGWGAMTARGSGSMTINVAGAQQRTIEATSRQAVLSTMDVILTDMGL